MYPVSYKVMHNEVLYLQNTELMNEPRGITFIFYKYCQIFLYSIKYLKALSNFFANETYRSLIEVNSSNMHPSMDKVELDITMVEENLKFTLQNGWKCNRFSLFFVTWKFACFNLIQCVEDPYLSNLTNHFTFTFLQPMIFTSFISWWVTWGGRSQVQYCIYLTF